MGTFNWPLRISSMDGRQVREIEATVDTGAAYTTLPALLLRELGVTPKGKRRFLLADGRRIEMDYGEAQATVGGESVTTIVVFGEDDAPALLGSLHPGMAWLWRWTRWSSDWSQPTSSCTEKLSQNSKRASSNLEIVGSGVWGMNPPNETPPPKYLRGRTGSTCPPRDLNVAAGIFTEAP